MEEYAIIIGINHYTPVNKRGLQTLGGAIPDAEKIYEWIRSETGGGVPEQNAFLIVSQDNPLNPIKHQIDEVISGITHQILERGVAAKRLYFYFAGHGLAVEDDDDNNGLCMANWNEIDKDIAALSSSDYRKKFKTGGLFQEIVMWLDCCRQVQVLFHPQGGGVHRYGLTQNPVYMKALAAQYENEAFEVSGPKGEKRGVFTEVLLEGLTGGADVDGQITAQSLTNYLYKHVPTRAQSYGYSQVPEIYGNHHEQNPIIF
ncbi:caspase family protein [uncultured Flavobacterium sp.]|uniref:caspase family protein n=1 Tax=uncultured Flavobacterium sp. TaxID=165435 RepID=UPI0025CF8464|nr:caspase family protein [uncultured Flavobacterium sp.]